MSFIRESAAGGDDEPVFLEREEGMRRPAEAGERRNLNAMFSHRGKNLGLNILGQLVPPQTEILGETCF